MKTKLFILKFLFLSLITTSIFAQVNPNGTISNYEIRVKFKTFKDKSCYLGFHFGNNKYISDTAKVDSKGLCIFKGVKPKSGGVYLIITPEKDYFEFIFAEQKISMETDTGDFVAKMKIISSKENDMFYSYLKYMKSKHEELTILQAEKKPLKAPVDSVKIKTIDKQINNLDQETKDFRKKIIADNPTLFFTKVLNSMDEPLPRDKGKNEPDSTYGEYVYNFYQYHFFDNIDFSDQRMLRTPILDGKIDKYMEKLSYRNPDSLKYSAARLIDRSMASEEAFKYILPKMFNKYAQSQYMGMDAIVVYLAKKYYLSGLASWADSAQLAKIYDRVAKMENNLLGQQATELIMKDTSGNYKSLFQMKSVYTVLVFWDITCSHCRKIIPELKHYYDSLGKHDPNHDSIDIYAVYIGNDLKGWKKFVVDNNLNWTNVADPYNYTNFRVLYDIFSTPVIYVLDKKKHIIAKKIAWEQINEIVAAYNKDKSYLKKK